jgi:hypothetical protein
MTTQLDRTVTPDAVVRFTTKGQRALDALAATIVNRMATTPDGIASTLDMVFHTPIEELAEALTQIADQLDHIQHDEPLESDERPAPLGWQQ